MLIHLNLTQYGYQKVIQLFQEKHVSKWLFDSGCTRHMTGDSSLLTDLTDWPTTKKVKFADNNEGTIVGRGNIGNIDRPFLRDVYLVNGLKHNLINISQLCNNDCIVKFEKHLCSIINSKGVIIAKGYRKNNMLIP